MQDLEEELIQIRPPWYPNGGGVDVNKWSRIHPRFLGHNGCIVDLGCLGWDKNFEDISSDNWSGFFFGKKRVIGVDPQELPNSSGELFKGFVSNFTGRGDLLGTGIGASIIRKTNGSFEVLSFHDFKKRYRVENISILKVNIEGGEWDLIDSLEPNDFHSIDQIAISFHDWLPGFGRHRHRTRECINKIISYGFSMIDLGLYGWRLFIRENYTGVSWIATDRSQNSEVPAQTTLSAMPLNELQQARGLSRKSRAEVLHVQHASIAKIDKHTDTYLSALRSYIEVMGGELEIIARFPDCSVKIRTFSDLGETPSELGGD